MASPADRFTRLEKIAVFLIAMGEARSREILADFDLATIEQINDTIGFLGDITPQEKAAVMIEFGDFFYKNKPLSSKLHPPKKTKSNPEERRDHHDFHDHSDLNNLIYYSELGAKNPWQDPCHFANWP